MKNLSFVLVYSIVFMIAACGDDSSSATHPSDELLSSTAQSTSSPSSVPGLTGDFLIDSRDGQTYKTVTIGSQTWMAQNLNYAMANSYCYNDNTSNCVKYGRLYTWNAATKACPSGWHLPIEPEFRTLFTAVGGRSTAGTKLKSTSGWYRNGNGNDEFSFSALPAGSGGGKSLYGKEGQIANFWCSTESDYYEAWHMYLSYDDVNAYLGGISKEFGLSVRCVQD